MRLIVAHQILIGSAIALAALFGARALYLFTQDKSGVNLVMAIIAAGIGATLAMYLRVVRAKSARQHRSGPRI